MRRANARVLVVGVGGLGCPTALALARSSIAVLGLCDDDEVERTNLHRQILFRDADVGAQKVDAAARALREAGTGVALRLHRTRLLPDNAVQLVSEYDIVLEGSDNFATKFLAADACSIAGVAVVHASAVRWIGTALAVGATGGPCYRCVFEDIPEGEPPNCAEAGVVGPVVGIVAAAQVDLALAMVDGHSVGGELVTFDGRSGVMRRRIAARRPDCALCGHPPRIQRIEPASYGLPACAG
jgi:molybdopterin/thiamine biosynthesis adenylyltransferase